MRRLLCSVLALSFFSACAAEVDGPEPQMAGTPDDLVTDPGFVCNEAHPQEGTWITLDGEAFSPLVVDAIASEADHDAQLPIITLILREGAAGEEVESSSFVLESPLGTEDGQVRWIDDGTMMFRITDDLELPEGVYDIEVENPNGRIATEFEAFGVIDRPELHRAIPEMTCVAQGERQVVLEGKNFLVRGSEDEVPTVRLEGEEVEVVESSDCRELHATFGNHQLCQELTVRLDEQQFEAGVYDVWVENFAPAGCPSSPEDDGVTITVNDPPQVDSISPTPVCSEQIAYEAMEVDGQEFITVELDGETIYPTVAIGDEVYEAVDALGCEGVESASALGAQRCTQLLIDVEADDLAVQVDEGVTHEDLAVVVTNPDPVGCHSTQDEVLTAMPPPSVEVVAPDPMCTAQYDNEVVVEGHGFAIIDGLTPVVHVGAQSYPVEQEALEGCTEIERPQVETWSCQRLTISVAEQDLGVDRHDVRVENPETAGCTSTEESTVQVVAPPTVEAIEPRPLCAAQEERTLAIFGAGFLDIDGALPQIAIGEEELDATDVEDCEPVEVDDDTREVFSCETVIVDVAGGLLDADTHEVVVTNPEGAQCNSVELLEVQTVPPPEITSVNPRALCTNEETTQFSVEGEHFYEVGGEAPTVMFDGNAFQTAASGCAPAEQGDDVQVCTSLAFEVDPQQISDDIHRMVAVNPDPIGCESAESDPLVLAGPPQLVTTDPVGVCSGDTLDPEMTLMGTFVHEPGGEQPVVTMGGIETTVESFDDCVSTDVGAYTLDSCSEMETIVPESLRDQGFEITVEAAEPVACGMDSIVIEEYPTPTITAVIPERICQDGGSLQVTGTDLHPDANYFLGGMPASDVDYHSDQSVTVSFGGPISPGMVEFEVVNPGDCSTTYSEDIRVTEGPVPLFVDPPATFDGMTTQVTIYAAGLHGGSIEVVELVHPDGTATALEIEVDDERPHIVQAVVPEGMLDDTEDSVDFGIRLRDDISCGREASDLLTITSELTVAVEAIEPAFGGTGEATGVEIYADDDPDPGMVQFEAVPRAYLNPSNLEDEDEEGMLATEIRSLQFIDETELNGIVPSGLPVGIYDLIVVNPDGAIGVLAESYEVTEELPPRIDGVSPGSWSNQESELTVDVEGANFRENLEVEVFCQAPDEELQEDQMTNPASISVVDVEDESIELEVDVTNIAHLDVCFMRVTNEDGTFGEYAPITVTNPGGNFVEFNAGTEFEIARRGPTAFSGVPSPMRHYLYVIGGDDGTSQDSAFTSGEFARLDRFGMPQEWNELPYHLPSGRTFADGVRIDDFLYLVGGYDAEEGAPTDEVLRAQVLDPLDAPEIVSIDILLDEALEGGGGLDSELEAGTYYYRVSAVYTSDDPANPGGESLASEPQPLTLPLEGLAVTISWEPPEHINHDIDYYRVYRSVEANDPYGGESLIATVDAPDTSYEDTGTDEPAVGVHPLPVGSLGTWKHVATLERERTAAGVTSAQNPNNPDQHFIYVVAGEGIDDEGDSVELDDYEFVTVDVGGPRQQLVADGTIGLHDGDPMTLPAGRTDLRAGTASESNASSVSDVPPQVFTIGGQSSGDNDRNLYVTSVTHDGHLEEWTQLSITVRLNNPRIGHGGDIINDQMVVAGGRDGTPDDTAAHARLQCDTLVGTCPPATLGNWSSLSNVEMEPRIFMGQEAFRGFWYLAGGLDGNLEATNTVDFSVAGGAP